ncbi:MAG: hypothetical protein V1849_01065 [Chloroflexota bacterium]
MISGTSDELKDTAGKYRCPEHPNPLTVAYHAESDCYVIRCGAGHYPEEITRIPSLTEEHRQGILQDGPVKDNLVKKLARAVTGGPVTPASLRDALLPRTDLGTGNLLTADLVEGLKLYAYAYELDPYRGHVVLMYGKPYISLDGYLFHAYRGHVNFSIASRPLKPGERPEYQIPEGSHAWITTITWNAGKQLVTGLGIVTLEEMTGKSKKDPSKLASPVVAAYPWQLAQKRAEWQALRRAFPIGNTEEVNP